MHFILCTNSARPSPRSAGTAAPPPAFGRRRPPGSAPLGPAAPAGAAGPAAVVEVNGEGDAEAAAAEAAVAEGEGEGPHSGPLAAEAEAEAEEEGPEGRPPLGCLRCERCGSSWGSASPALTTWVARTGSKPLSQRSNCSTPGGGERGGEVGKGRVRNRG
jgi:hypothetical protein